MKKPTDFFEGGSEEKVMKTNKTAEKNGDVVRKSNQLCIGAPSVLETDLGGRRGVSLNATSKQTSTD